VDLEEVADELYGSSPEDFVERRTERVARARQAGDRAVAKQISQLRRPTRTAWMVNLLARANPAEITQLLDLGRALQDAQQRAAGDDLRRLSKSRRSAVDVLTRQAADLARAAGHAPAEGTVQEVSQTLQAALADPAIADLVQRGRLTQAASYGGFGPSSPTSDSSADLLAALAASVGGQQDRPSPDQDQAEPDQVAHPDLEAQRELEEAVRSWEAAAGEAATAADEADQATTHADDFAERIESLRDELRQAESAEREARDEARAARKRAQQLRQEAAAAEQRATALRERLGNHVR
jgi:hypothetical protein